MSSDINLSVPQAADQPVVGTIPADTVPATPSVEATPVKPRSGFARQKLKIQRLTDLYDNLLLDHEQLLLSYNKLEAEYHQLEDAFNEITALNSSLAGELREARQHRPTFGSTSFGSLMGMMR
jgi:hypothetical protein